MNQCRFNPVGEPDENGKRLMRCEQCGKECRATTAGVNAKCRKGRRPYSPCLHRGESTRQQECDSCAGKTRIKIFACAIHGECTIGKKLESLACCAGCKDYQSP
jgi:hypothetical protein